MEGSAVEVRLVQLLGSFITTTSAYVLARLEYALRHPEDAAPPLIARLPDASQATLQTFWDAAEQQLESACRYVKVREGARERAHDASFVHLQRTVRELEQYARAVRWVMTVDEGR